MKLPRLLFLLVLTGCGSPNGSPAESPSVVEIEEVTPKQSEALEKLPEVPEATRTEPAEVSEFPENPGGGGPDCDRAADCCLQFMQKSTPDPAMLAMCDSVRQAPPDSCAHLLTSFQQVAPQLGVTCR